MAIRNAPYGSGYSTYDILWTHEVDAEDADAYKAHYAAHGPGCGHINQKPVHPLLARYQMAAHQTP